MDITVIIYRIDTTYDDGGWGGTTYQADYFIHVIFDTVTKLIRVEIKASSNTADIAIYTPTDGPHLFYGYSGAVTRVYPANIADLYAACEGTTLDYMNVNNLFPYASYAYILDSPLCYIAPVCDLEFTSIFSVTPASGPATADGAFTVLATSSNGTIKYSLIQNFDYATQGSTSGTFSALLPGDYVVYAQDPLGCQASFNINLKVTTVYGTRWRLEYTDLNGNNSRIDIEERAYAGAVNEYCAGDEPITIEYHGDVNNPYQPIIPSSATITLLTEVESQFEDIFIGDDLKYKVKHYKNIASAGEYLHWAGYIVPELYSEPYLAVPFIITATAVDGLAELASAFYVDEHNNNYRGDLKPIKQIAELLKKYPLDLPVRSCVDIFETNMTTTVADDPLDKITTDSRIFYNKNVPVKCDEVISKQIKPFGARIFQAKGCWYITRVESSIYESLPYREFDINGDYSSNGTLVPLYDLSYPNDTLRFIWSELSQVLSHNRNYGYFKITHDLARDENLIDEGDFEVNDLIEDAIGDVFFKNWNFNIGQQNMSFGHETLLDGTGAFFAKYQTNTDGQNDSVLYTIALPFSITAGGFVAGDRFKISFKVFAELYYMMPWVRVAWQVKITNLDTGDFYSFYPPQNDKSDWEINQEVKNDLYIEKFNGFQEFELGLFNLQSSIPNATLELSFYFHNHANRDYNDYAVMRTLDTVDFSGFDKRLYFSGAGTSTKSYKLERTTDAESEPNIIRPSDYNATTNPQQWVLQEDIFLGGGAGVVSKFLFDKVAIAFYPFLSVGGNFATIVPPETTTYVEEVSRFVKFDFEETVYLGDVPDFNNSEYIYKGFFKLIDGTPTQLWTRAGVTEENFLNQILLNDYKAQMSSPVRKLSGVGRSDTVIHYYNFFRDYLDNKNYINTNLTFEDKAARYTVELIEVLGGESAGTPPDNSAFTIGFSEGFLA